MAKAQKNAAEKKGKRGLSPIYLDESEIPEASNIVYLRSDRRRRLVFGWYGGKFSHLDWLLPLLPECHHYDSPRTLFYCDPPYLHATRGDSKAYGFEMDENQHREFADAVHHCRGMVAVSGYDHPLMDELFKPGKWFKTRGADKTNHSTKGKRQEVLWTNYNPKDKSGDLFA